MKRNISSLFYIADNQIEAYISLLLKTMFLLAKYVHVWSSDLGQ